MTATTDHDIDSPDIWAIVVNYNAGERLLQCVQTLLIQPELSRIWIVDNASNDDSLRPIISLAAANERIGLIHNTSNIGFGAANNIILRKTQDVDWLLVNPDCMLMPGAVRAFLTCRRAHARGGLFGGLVRNPDGSEQRGCRRDLPQLGTSVARTLGLQRLFGRNKWTDFDHANEALPSTPVRVQAVSGAFMYWRAQAVQEAGIFDEGYFLHCEDLDICRRFADKDWEVWFVPGAEAVHFQGTSSRQTPLRVHWHKHRSMWRYFSKFQRQESPSWLTALVWFGIWSRFLVLLPSIWFALIHRHN